MKSKKVKYMKEGRNKNNKDARGLKTLGGGDGLVLDHNIQTPFCIPSG
jgi:hypothetical protein